MEKEFSTEVMEAYYYNWEEPVYNMPVEEPNAGVPVYVWIIVGVAVVAAAATTLVVVKKRRMKKETEDNDEDI